MPEAGRFIEAMAKKGGSAAMKLFGSAGVRYSKSANPTDVVTKADLVAEKIIVSAIRAKFPDHGILAEESGGRNEGAEYVWTVDPVDGTLNFARSIPLFGTMISLSRAGEPLVAALYLPVTRELFFARAGRGAYRNGKRIRCSENPRWDRSGGCGSSLVRARARFLRFTRNFIRFGGSHSVLNLYGSIAASACYVAAGRKDWFVSFGAHAWDYAPAALLMKESGCTVTNGAGKPWKIGDAELIAASPCLHREILKLAKGI